MARIKYVYRDGVGLVEVERDGVRVGEEVNHAKGPSVILDSMDPVLHPCTGETIDSKSQFRRITKAHNCYEVGGSMAEHKRETERFRAESDAKFSRSVREQLRARIYG